MPGYKNLRKGKYGERALAYILEKTYANNVRLLQMVMSHDEYQKLTDDYYNIVDNKLVDYNDKVESVVDGDHFEKKLYPQEDQAGIELFERMVKNIEKAKKNLGNELEDFKGYYDNLAMDHSMEGNLLEARYESQYLLKVNQVAGGPLFGKYSSDYLKKGLMGEKDEVTGKYKGPYEPLMDYYQSTANLHKLEFLRQKYNEEGWDKDKENQFLIDLKAEQERLVDSFDRLYAIEDDGRYDKYLNNTLEEITGKKGNSRSAYISIGTVKGQIKAIENGWAQDELVILGAIGRMEAHFEKAVIEFENKMKNAHEYKKLGEGGIDKLTPGQAALWAEGVGLVAGEEYNRKVLKEYKEELKNLKDAAWNKKIKSLEDKEEIVNSLNAFIKKHVGRALGGYDAAYKLGVGAESAVVFVNNVMTKLAAEKEKAANQNVEQDKKNDNVQQNVEPKVEDKVKAPETEIYDFSISPEDMENNGFVGSEEERKEKAKTALQAYAAQSSKEDKIFFYLSYAAKNAINQNPPETTIELPAGMTEAEKNELKQKASDNYKNALEQRKNAGIHPAAQTSVEEDECMDELQNRLLLDLVGDGSREFIIDSFKSFGIVNAININNQGKKYKAFYDSLDKNEKNREKKALYLAYKTQGHEAMMNSAISSFSSMGFVSVFNYADDTGIAVKEKIFENLKYRKDKTTFKDFFDKLGYTSDERKLFIADNKCGENDKIYDYYKAKLIKEGKEEPSDEDILETVKDEYTGMFKDMVINTCLKGPVEYFNTNYSDNMKIRHYMNLLRLNDDQKKEFLSHYNANANDSVHDVFKNYIESHEDIKNGILDANEQAELERTITEVNIKEFAGRMIGEELAGKRRKIDTFNKNYSGDMTVEQYLKIIQSNEFEQNDFLAAYDTTANSKIKDVFSKELSEQKGNNAQITDEEIKAYARSKMTEMINKQMNSGKFVTEKTEWGGMYIHFADNMKLFTDKDIYMHGHIVNGGEDVVPKQNPKTESQKEFKEWVSKVGKKIVDDSFMKEQTEAFQQVSNVIYSKKAINLRNEDVVADFFDNAVPISNPTFLQGAITALENTKTGTKLTNSSKERSSNSEKYETMLKAIKEYHKMMITDDKFGLVGARDELKTACINYISGKESVRKRDFGKERFDVAMTVLFDIMPRKDFVKVINKVNRSRSNNDIVNFDTYNVKYAELYSAEENREEERQLKAQNKYLTEIPKDYEKKMENVLNVFGLEPKADEQLNAVFNDFEETFSKVEGDLAPIGKGLNKHKLSNEDFAAIAYAGTLSDAATEHDSRLTEPDLKANKLLLTAKDYTLAFAKDNIPPETKEYAQVIKTGRQNAVEAIKEYEKGDKFILAAIIASGLRHIAAMSRFSEKIDENFICNGEMGRRMIDMLNRDAQLKSMVMNGAAYQSINDDIAYIDTINQATKVYNKAKVAEKKLIDVIENVEPDNLTKEEKQDLIADIMMLKVLDSSKEMYHKSVDETLKSVDKWKKKVNDIEIQAADELDAVIGIEDRAAREKLIDAAYLKKDLRILVLKDYLRNDKLLLSLTTDKSVSALRKSVKEMVEESGFDKLTPLEIYNKLNDKKLMAKLGTITKTANQKSENIYSNRKAAEARSAREAEQKRKARRATKPVKK